MDELFCIFLIMFNSQVYEIEKIVNSMNDSNISVHVSYLEKKKKNVEVHL
jgi:hypothetical protein